MKSVRLISPLVKQVATFDTKIHRCIFGNQFHRHQEQHTSAKKNEESEIVMTEKLELQQPSITKWRRPPFIKKLFVGEFDTHVLAFPEVLNKEQVEELEQCVRNIRDLFKDKVVSSQIESKQKIPETVLEDLKSLGIFGRLVPKKYGGLGLTRTEYLRLNEVVSLDTSIGTMLCAHELMAVQAILEFGSEDQKKKYLPDLASGKKVAAVAFTEAASGSDHGEPQTRIQYLLENDLCGINGVKNWVTNAETADLFLVFVKDSDTQLPDEACVTCVLVDKNTEGLQVRKCDSLVGLKGCGIADVFFKEVFIQKENILGNPGQGTAILSKVMEFSKFGIGSLTISALKCLYDSIVDFVINAERCGQSLSYYQLMRRRLSKVMQMIYAMESVAYFNAAIYDTTEKPDFALEDIIMKVFNTEGALYCAQELMAALGALSVLNKDLDIGRFHRDVQMLLSFDHSNDLNRLLIGLVGCQFAGDHHGDYILKLRNPALFPWDRVLWMWKNHQQKKEVFKYHQDIAGHIHPSLTLEGNQLEECVQRLQLAVDTSLEIHGRDIVNTQFSPYRLADLAINLYARTAVLSRISRSYCIGLTNTHEELRIATNFCASANKSFMKTFLEVAERVVIQDDDHLQIGQDIVNKKGYFLEHPLKHNF